MKTKTKVKLAGILRKFGENVPDDVLSKREIAKEVQFRVENGKDGQPGRDGKDGNNGRDGKDGTSVSLEEVVDTLRPEIFTRFSWMHGGGNANRNIQVNSVNVLTPYTDINLIAGTGITITTVANNTTKYADMTITATGSGSQLTAETPTGTVDDSNVTFTVVHQPLYIVVNGAQYTVGTGLYSSYVAGTITLSSPVGTGGFIVSFYNG